MIPYPLTIFWSCLTFTNLGLSWVIIGLRNCTDQCNIHSVIIIVHVSYVCKYQCVHERSWSSPLYAINIYHKFPKLPNFILPTGFILIGLKVNFNGKSVISYSNVLHYSIYLFDLHRQSISFICTSFYTVCILLCYKWFHFCKVCVEMAYVHSELPDQTTC